MMRKRRILSDSTIFSAGRLLLPAYNFATTMASNYSVHRLGALASLIFLWLKTCSQLFGPCILWPNGPGYIVLGGYPAPPTERGTAAPTFRPTVLARIPAGPHFAHNPYCRLGNARRAACVELLPDNCHPSNLTSDAVILQSAYRANHSAETSGANARGYFYLLDFSAAFDAVDHATAWSVSYMI